MLVNSTRPIVLDIFLFVNFKFCYFHFLNLQCIYECEGKHKHGITNVHLTGNRVIAARLSGRIDFLRLETYNKGRHIDWGFTTAYRRSIKQIL